eukprot:TRINITY_DN1842_c0_g1_i1.p1 TRINITY_DN1842_c0_g1~~TRINITY_DN1842_c0_g1_i1.p1  ORF type:complete len:329 (-),score=54.78 TRINITY_DN1842_c0_g1_i1:111-1097(-)
MELELLSFDTPLIDEEKQIKRRRAIEEVICHQVQFFVNVLANVLQFSRLKGAKDFKIGVIGIGQIGRAVLRALIEKGFPKDHIVIGSRRRETAKRFIEQGVEFLDNKDVVKSKGLRLLVVCCLPSQVSNLCTSIRAYIRKRTMVVSTVSGLSDLRLSELLGVNSVATSANVSGLPEVLGTVSMTSLAATQLCDEEVGKQRLLAALHTIYETALRAGVPQEAAIHEAAVALFGEEMGLIVEKSIPHNKSEATVTEAPSQRESIIPIEQIFEAIDALGPASTRHRPWKWFVTQFVKILNFNHRHALPPMSHNLLEEPSMYSTISSLNRSL